MIDPIERPIVIIACAVFQHLLEELLTPGVASQITFLEYGLHVFPKKLNSTLQETLDNLPQPSRVVLGYGLCGNGLNDIYAGLHTLLVPRTDDCIAILYGSYQRYRREFDTNPGTYYLTKGWLEAGSDPLREHQNLIEKYGPEKADWIMEMQYKHYRRLVFVAHTQEDLEEYRPRALEVAKYCQRWGMIYEESLGSDAYIRNLIAAIQTLEATDQDFVVVQPGNTLKQALFFR